MGNYEDLKKAISAVIRQNGNQEITGKVLQDALLSIISNVGKNSTFAGIATPETNPGSPDSNVFYIAAKEGIYSNFGGKEIKDTVAIFENKGGTWIMYPVSIATKSCVEKVGKISEKLVYIPRGEMKIDFVEKEVSYNDIRVYTLTGKAIVVGGSVMVTGKISFANLYIPNISTVGVLLINPNEKENTLNGLFVSKDEKEIKEKIINGWYILCYIRTTDNNLFALIDKYEKDGNLYYNTFTPNDIKDYILSIPNYLKYDLFAYKKSYYNKNGSLVSSKFDAMCTSLIEFKRGDILKAQNLNYEGGYYPLVFFDEGKKYIPSWSINTYDVELNADNTPENSAYIGLNSSSQKKPNVQKNGIPLDINSLVYYIEEQIIKIKNILYPFTIKEKYESSTEKGYYTYTGEKRDSETRRIITIPKSQFKDIESIKIETEITGGAGVGLISVFDSRDAFVKNYERGIDYGTKNVSVQIQLKDIPSGGSVKISNSPEDYVRLYIPLLINSQEIKELNNKVISINEDLKELKFESFYKTEKPTKQGYYINLSGVETKSNSGLGILTIDADEIRFNSNSVRIKTKILAGSAVSVVALFNSKGKMYKATDVGTQYSLLYIDRLIDLLEESECKKIKISTQGTENISLYIETTDGLKKQVKKNTEDIKNIIGNEIFFTGSSSVQRLESEGVTGKYRLDKLTERKIIFSGVGGENMKQICARIGSEALIVEKPFIIPKGKDPVVIGNSTETLFVTRGTKVIFQTQQGLNLPKLNPITINGVRGILETRGSYGTGDYIFTRETDGKEEKVKKGDIIYSDNIIYRKYPIITALGYNKGYDNLQDYISYHKRVAQFTYQGKFLFITRLVDGSWEKIDEIKREEQQMLLEFGSNVFVLREWLVNHAIEIAINEGLLDGSLYPTVQDMQDMGNGYVPTSLRMDGAHLTNEGYKVMSIALKEKIIELGM